jgi:N-acetylglucosaminyldiphosphoundecaprenol N-acetyl-beta-D-mannosaminyltransferase
VSDRSTIKLLGYDIYVGDRDFFSTKFRGVINTLNPHSCIVARKDKLFHEALMASDILLPDGVGILIGVWVLTGKRIKRFSGSDLHQVIINSLNMSGSSCFYLGSSEETLQKIKMKLSSEYPSVAVGSFSPTFKNEFNDDDNFLMIKAVNDFNPAVLFVGMTAPKQEKWIYKNRNNINAPVICTIGAAFDFYAGTVKRPGKFWISLGLEWLPRLLREPRRLWRRNFVSNPFFLLLVFSEKAKHILSAFKIK